MIQITSKNHGTLFVVTNRSKEIVGTIKREAGGAFSVADKRSRDNPPPFPSFTVAIEYFHKDNFDWDNSLGYSNLHIPASRSIRKVTGRKQRWSLS